MALARVIRLPMTMLKDYLKDVLTCPHASNFVTIFSEGRRKGELCERCGSSRRKVRKMSPWWYSRLVHSLCEKALKNRPADAAAAETLLSDHLIGVVRCPHKAVGRQLFGEGTRLAESCSDCCSYRRMTSPDSGAWHYNRLVQQRLLLMPETIRKCELMGYKTLGLDSR